MPHKKKKKIRVNYDCVNQGDGGNYTFEERFPLIRNRVPLLNFSKKIGGGRSPLYYEATLESCVRACILTQICSHAHTTPPCVHSSGLEARPR